MIIRKAFNTIKNIDYKAAGQIKVTDLLDGAIAPARRSHSASSASRLACSSALAATQGASAHGCTISMSLTSCLRWRLGSR